ncbi:MAG: TraR/DksA family transcriptional regulator [Kiritimatiellae bacterium]|nr:TraR/DksA family transcriptional regulator [Kiritimatiellia bacterium]
MATKKTAPASKKAVETKTTSKKAVPQPDVIETSPETLDFAFSFAEMMKKESRKEDAAVAAQQPDVRLPRRPTTRTKGKSTLQFPESDLAEFKKRLLQLRQNALGQSSTLRNVALEQSDERVTEDEDGSDAQLRLQSLNQVDSQNRLIRKIDVALRRIENGTYGVCEECGQLIRKPRLLNMPFVHTCMECQSEMESRGPVR